MITINTLDSAIFEAERFIKRAKEASIGYQRQGYSNVQIYGKEAAAVKRSSMDLTRELAMLRKSGE